MNSYCTQISKQLDMLKIKIKILENNIETEQEKIQTCIEDIKSKEMMLNDSKDNIEKCKKNILKYIEDEKTLRYHLDMYDSMNKSRRFLKWNIGPFDNCFS